MYDLCPMCKLAEDPFESFMKRINHLFNDGDISFPKNTHSFRTDIRETETAYLVEAELPGFTKDDITVELEDNCFTIRAKREEQKGEKDEQNRFIHQERHYGEYIRRFCVDDIREDGIKAKLENGILTIEIPKADPDKPNKKRISID